MGFSVIMTKKITKTKTERFMIFYTCPGVVFIRQCHVFQKLDLPLLRTESLSPHESSRWVPGWFGYN